MGSSPVRKTPSWTGTASGMRGRRDSHGDGRRKSLSLLAVRVTDYRGIVESWRFFWAPVNVQLESGDRFEFNWVPWYEYLPEPFALAESVTSQRPGLRQALDPERPARRLRPRDRRSSTTPVGTPGGTDEAPSRFVICCKLLNLLVSRVGIEPTTY